jgi:hypothetical protein
MTTHGTIKGIIANLILIEPDGKVSQNEICQIGTEVPGPNPHCGSHQDNR